MALPFYLWSKVAATNASVDPTINLAEGMSPSAVNDSIRAVMADLAAFRDDISGTLLSTGTSTAYVLATNQVFDTLAHMHGALLCWKPHVTSGVLPTLAVDGLAAKLLTGSTSFPSPTGEFLIGRPYLWSYNNTDNTFYLVSN